MSSQGDVQILVSRTGRRLDVRLKIACQSEVLVHDDRETPLMVARAVMLSHEPGLRPALPDVPFQPVVDRLDIRK